MSAKLKPTLTLNGESYTLELWETILAESREEIDKIQACVEKHNLDKDTRPGTLLVDVLTDTIDKQVQRIAELEAALADATLVANVNAGLLDFANMTKPERDSYFAANERFVARKGKTA